MRIAVIGSGISGLGAAHLLARAHEVEVFERDVRAGGHANTVLHDGLALDTGFLVHNGRNYPLLGRLFEELGVRTHESEMSFSVACAGCGLEYSGRRPFATPANAARPGFLSLLWEIGRWLRTARPSLERHDYESHSLGEYLDERRYSRAFRRHFLVPLTSALWSTAPGRALEFPAAYAIRFFDNHGMLGLGRFRWRTVSGGSREYVDAVARGLGERLHLGLGARSVRRTPGSVEVRTDDGSCPPSTLSSSRRTPTRRSRSSRTRATTSAACSGPSTTRGTTPSCTPTRPSCRGLRAHVRRGTTASPTTAVPRSRTTSTGCSGSTPGVTTA
jgi:predicted NAD/FAD-binding protein